LFQRHDWPGNVRELKNVIEKAVSLGVAPAPPAVAGGREADGRHLPPFQEARERMVQAFERDYLRALVKGCDGNLRKAARDAGIDRAYLYRLLHKHGLKD
jgi:DNA-binding NtrC family response regulator